MTTTERDERGYKIPDEPNPEGSACIRVYVPDDQLYIAAFMNAYRYFGIWAAWERDSEHRGSLAAAAWRERIAMTEIELDCSAGDCGMKDIRQSTTEPCLIEAKQSCDDEWSEVYDGRLCVPKMRLFNGVLQQDTTGNGDWVDAGDPDTPYDDRTDGVYPVNWETPPEGQDGKCLSALNAIAFLRGVVSGYANLIDAGSNAVTGLLYWLSSIQIIAFVQNVLTELTADLDALMSGSTGDWGDVSGYDFTSDIVCILYDAYNADGTMGAVAWSNIGADVQDVIDEKTELFQKTALRLANIALFALGPVGMSRVSNFGSIASGDCSDCTGTFEHYFDFTTGAHGWVGDDLVYPGAVLETGLGWRYISNDNKDQVFIRLEHSEIASGVNYKIHLSNGWNCCGGEGASNAIAYFAPNATIPTGWYGVVDRGEDVIEYPLGPVDEPVTSVELGMECSSYCNSQQGYIIGVTITGPGSDPF